MRRSCARSLWALGVSAACAQPEAALTLLSDKGLRAASSKTHIEVEIAHEHDADINRALVLAGLDVSQFWRPELSLEQLFFALTRDAEVGQ